MASTMLSKNLRPISQTCQSLQQQRPTRLAAAVCQQQQRHVVLVRAAAMVRACRNSLWRGFRNQDALCQLLPPPPSQAGRTVVLLCYFVDSVLMSGVALMQACANHFQPPKMAYTNRTWRRCRTRPWWCRP